MSERSHYLNKNMKKSIRSLLNMKVHNVIDISITPTKSTVAQQ